MRISGLLHKGHQIEVRTDPLNNKTTYRVHIARDPSEVVDWDGEDDGWPSGWSAKPRYQKALDEFLASFDDANMGVSRHHTGVSLYVDEKGLARDAESIEAVVGAMTSFANELHA